MSFNKICLTVVFLSVWSCVCVGAETWHLGDGQDWSKVSKDDVYLSAVSAIKQLINSGDGISVRKALEKLKKDFPEIAGGDLDSFIEAEVYYGEGEFVKAVRGYDKFLEEYPDSALHEAAVDRQFSIATAYLAGAKKPVLKVFKIKGYAEGEKIMDKIGEREGESPVAARAAIAIAKSYEKRNKHNEAYSRWSEVSSKWPTGAIGKESLLAMGRCKHADYRGPKYDSSNLVSAKSYYEDFASRYSADAERLEIGKRIAQIKEQLSYKQLAIGQYYEKTGNKQAANFYYEMVISDWPDSMAAQIATDVLEPESEKKDEEEETWKTRVIKKFEKLFL